MLNWHAYRSGAKSRIGLVAIFLGTSFFGANIALATGSVDCTGKLAGAPVSISWGTSHSIGSMMISPISIKIGKEKEMTLCDARASAMPCEKPTAKGPVVGYWVSGERILVNVVDDNIERSLFLLETWYDKKKKTYSGHVKLTAPLSEKEQKILVKCEQS